MSTPIVQPTARLSHSTAMSISVLVALNELEQSDAAAAAKENTPPKGKEKRVLLKPKHNVAKAKVNAVMIAASAVAQK